MRTLSFLAVPALALALAPATAHATDGHFLHGVGAVNSAIGGIGVASNASLLGSFYSNPAGIASFAGTNLEMGFKMLKPTRTVSSSFGTFFGTTTSTSEFTPIPAFGFSTALSNRVVIGLSGLGIGGFGVNYPGNPIPDEQSMFNIPAPAIVQHHITGGVGFMLRDGVELNLAAYAALEHSITGAMYRPTAVPGTSVTNMLSESSVLLGFTFRPAKK